MDFNELRNTILKERDSQSLTKIKDNFYEEIDKYVEIEEDFYIMRSKRISAEELKRIRYNKIINLAKNSVLKQGETDLSKLNKDEKQFYIECTELFKKWIKKVEL